MTSDGVCYLDMADAWLKGDWKTGVNALRSPFYSWAFALALQVLKPSPDTEFTATHFVNFAVYLATLGSFEFFWSELVQAQRARKPDLSGTQGVTLPAWLWLALGYSLFTWSSLKLITVASIFPDLCVAGFLYLACGLVLRIRTGRAGWRAWAALGAVLGFGYLTKLPMLPMAAVFFAVGWFAAGSLRKAAPRLLLAAGVYFILTGPFMIALSLKEGRLTLGDSARLNYAWHVDGAPFVHWQGNFPPRCGKSRHPTRKIFSKPDLYEFGIPVEGTYPPWFDPSYWNEGLTPYVEWRNQARVLLHSARIYLELFVKGGLFLAVLILLFRRPRRWSWMRDVGENWILLIPALAGLAMYAPVHVETRYVGAFIVIFWAGVLAGVRVADSPQSEKLAAGLTAIPIVALLAITSMQLTGYFRKDLNRSVQAHGQVAVWLKRKGIRDGDRVGYIGFGRDAYWTRLARVRLVAEIPPESSDAFWAASPSVKSEVIAAFAKTGCKVIVAENVSTPVSMAGWEKIDETDEYAYVLPR